MLLTPLPFELKLHQIHLGLLRAKRTHHWPAAVVNPVALAARGAGNGELFARISQGLQLRETFEPRTRDRLIELGDPVEDFAFAGVHHGAEGFHTLVGVAFAADGEFDRVGAAVGFHDDFGVVSVDGYGFLAQLDAVFEQGWG